MKLLTTALATSALLALAACNGGADQNAATNAAEENAAGAENAAAPADNAAKPAGNEAAPADNAADAAPAGDKPAADTATEASSEQPVDKPE